MPRATAKRRTRGEPESRRIHVGVGGWTFAPWRGVFYPADLPRARELEYASRKLTSIEINATFYRAQTPASFRRWRDATPDGFVFAVKGPRYATQRRPLADAGGAIERFFGSGVMELGDKLGPILWQLPPRMRFDAEDIAAFLALLPWAGGRAIRHVLEVRHPSFADPRFVELLRRHEVAVAVIDSDEHPPIHDITADFVYVRLERASEAEPAGYTADALAAWARRVRVWAAGGEPKDAVRHAASAPAAPREAFVYFIGGAKVRNPAAAMAFMARVGAGSGV